MSQPLQALPVARRLVELETELLRITAERDRLARELRRQRARGGSRDDRHLVDRHAL